MQWTRAALLLCVAATACRFSVLGIDTGASDDMALSPVDLSMSGGGDMPPCECATGCSETPAHHCLALQPSGPVTPGDYGMTGVKTVTINANITINTDTGAITGPPMLMRAAGMGVINGIGFHVVMQSGGPGVGIFSVAGQALATGFKITITGSNAFALASPGPVQLDGFIDASCTGMTAGPGGFAGGMAASDGGGMAGAGKAGTSAAPTAASGGGGGAYGDAGGSGGLTTGAMANGGVPWGDLTTAGFILVGGAGGGGGGLPMGGKGGGGGGAVQIAVNDALVITGTIDVGGCGGLHGGKGTGGGGGGAGGAIVLEAVHVTLAASAVLEANGGGGAGGDDKSTNGNDANAGVAPASGGSTTSATGGNGGNGGASNGMPGQGFTYGRNGTIPDPTTGFGGGGGGGVGRIAVRAENGTMGGISDTSTAVTPGTLDINAIGAHPTIYGNATFQ
jgi:hypothetical protein